LQSNTSSLNKKYYASFIVNDFSRLTWVLFLTHKSEAFNFFKHFYKRMKRKIGSSIIKIRSHHSDEFENETFIEFCLYHGITHFFSTKNTTTKWYC